MVVFGIWIHSQELIANVGFSACVHVGFPAICGVCRGSPVDISHLLGHT
ncbi:unnamed protein product [Scytosiphon promiscuus]